MTQIVIHADDVGMCHGANAAFVELSASGVISAGSVMVPCPWFPEIAAIAADDPTLDVGVHLTLNAEQAGYRWAPVSRPSPASGLIDDDGYLWPSVAEVRANAHPDAVEAEVAVKAAVLGRQHRGRQLGRQVGHVHMAGENITVIGQHRAVRRQPAVAARANAGRHSASQKRGQCVGYR